MLAVLELQLVKGGRGAAVTVGPSPSALFIVAHLPFTSWENATERSAARQSVEPVSFATKEETGGG